MRIYFISLGCDKNLADSEVMLGLIHERGHTIAADEHEADIAIINTCCFIHDAKEESITAVLEMAQLKNEGKLKGIIVAGCLAQRYKDEIIKEIPEVDILIGTTAYDEILNAIDAIENAADNSFYKDIDYLPDIDVKRINTTGGYYGYLKIAEGCDKHCTYCIIPSLRGNFRSVPMEKLLKDARYMAENGIKELILVAQETTLYGTDIYGKKQLHVLIDRLCEIEGIEWIRVLYCYPEEIYDELIDTMAKQDKVCKYLDLPIQHASDDILKRMGRRTTQAELVEIIGKLRKRIPDIALRTSLITGFPGETQEDHECLMDFVKSIRFERLGVFTYSKEEDTPAAKLKSQIPKRVKEQRRKELMLEQQQIAFEAAKKKCNKKMKAIIDGYLPEDEIYVGRTFMDSPGIDGMVFINSNMNLLSGDIVDIEVIGSNDYDLIANTIKNTTLEG